MNTRTSIKDLPNDLKPSEKLIEKGSQSLSNVELVAILLRTGIKQKNVLEVADSLLQLCEYKWNELNKMDIHTISKIRGIGLRKATIILAALEIGKRQFEETLDVKQAIKSSEEAYHIIRSFTLNYKHEVFGILCLNIKHQIVGKHILSQGSITNVSIDIKTIIQKAIIENASSVLIFHTHPSGNITPSEADKKITQDIKAACALCQLKLVDHLIVSHNTYFSFNAEGLL